MAWIAEDKRSALLQTGQPLLSAEMQRHVQTVLFPRYPTKRACLLPVLHLVQHEYNWIPPEALVEVAELLELAPAEVLDTATFYEEYWLKPKGRHVVAVCRSIACEFCGQPEITDAVRNHLGIDVGETTDDGEFTLIELECLGSCGTAPAILIDHTLHENVVPGQIPSLLADAKIHRH